ncbi:AAA family ATPase, partial [Salmonella enterica]|nr:AAA family ATPase [Salmonella enterica]
MNDNFFTFRKIKVTGFNKLDAIIEFGSKLTILYGGSDSGKTYIYYLIRYLLGSEKLKNKDIDHAQGYDLAYLEFNFQGRVMTIERSLQDSAHYRLYDSSIENVSEANLLMVFSKSASSKKSFSSYFYGRLNFKEAKVRTNLSNTLHKFNLNNVFEFFCIDELRVLTEKSLILSDIPSEETKRKSEFKFLLTQRDDTNSLAEKPNKKARYFLKNQIANIYEELKAQLIYPEYDQVIVSR